MKVSNSGPKATNLPSTASTVASGEAAKVAKGGRSDKAASTVGADALAGSAKVDVSSRAQEMARAKALATPSNDIDEAKVARLQALIDGGKYKVDAGAIADKLVDEHMKMNE